MCGAGTSRHGAPVRTGQQIPWMICRLVHLGGWPLTDAAGSAGASIAHCASMRSWRLAAAALATRSPVGIQVFLVADPSTVDLFSYRSPPRRDLNDRQHQLRSTS
jgi:hypothetical protein